MSEESSEVGRRAKNLKRRSSLQKIMHICNQGYQVFPLVFLRVHDFQTTLSADFRKIIPLIKTMLVLRLGVYISVCLLSVELLCCLMFILRHSVPSGIFFLFGCVLLLSVLAFQVFNVISFRKQLLVSFFVKKKVK